MVKPMDAIRPPRLALATTAVALAGVTGCGLVPQSRLDECHRVTQQIRADNSRLKDLALDLRAQNQDLSQRAVDDARRLAAEQEAREHLENSVQAYQAERDKLAAAFEVLKSQIRTAVNTHAAAHPSQLEAFASAHPSWSFDEHGMTLSAPDDRLFEAGRDTLTPEAVADLKALASELSAPSSAGLALEVVVPAAGPTVVRAGYQAGQADKEGDRPASAAVSASDRFLAAARAARVRDRLIKEGGLDSSSVRLTPPTPSEGPSPDDAEHRIVIRVGNRTVAAKEPKTSTGSSRKPLEPR